jgi:hypothetical protein
MATDFFFRSPTFQIPALAPLAAFRWNRLDDQDVQHAIAAEEQYLAFHLFMLENLRHTEAGRVANPPYEYELGLSVRAGAVKAAVLMAASILEAALRAIAEKRGYPLSPDPKKRTFGNVIRAWENNGTPRPDVAAIWPSVRAIHGVRNYVHLHVASAGGSARWQSVLDAEQQLLNSASDAINHVATIVP